MATPLDFWLRFLDEEPRAAFFSALPENLTGGQQRFAENLFPQLQNRFFSDVGRQVRAGETPTRTFLETLNQQLEGPGSFENRFRRAPQFQTGAGSLSRPARFLFQR